MEVLKDLALAHQQREGWLIGSRSYRANNPGNLRNLDGSFRVFPKYIDGFIALENDLRAKIFGVAGSIKRYIKGTGKTYDQLVFQEYVSIYAPSADHNDPIDYCAFLCDKLKKYNVRPSTKLSVLAQLVNGTRNYVRTINRTFEKIDQSCRIRSTFPHIDYAPRWTQHLRRIGRSDSWYRTASFWRLSHCF